MSPILILLDLAPGPEVGIISGVMAAGFLLVLLAVALVAFLALRRTLKMAFRLAIVGVILLIAFAGSVSLWFFTSGSSPKPRPRPTPPVNGRR